MAPPLETAPLPTLIIVGGPPGAGKTTLAHEVARRVGCPAICRDEIKEGMVHATPGFVPAQSDDLTMRTFPVFFSALEVLLRAGVTTVAEAAFQDRLWQMGLAPLRDLAHVRILHCSVTADVALDRKLQRARQDPLRRAHADPDIRDNAAHALIHDAFKRLTMDGAPWIEIDTSDGYRPGLDEIVAFINQ